MLREQRLRELRRLLGERILVLDGAMGTVIQSHRLDEAAYRGERFADWSRDLKGNNDLLVLTRPALIADIHRRYLEAGADIIETNTFNVERAVAGRLRHRAVRARDQSRRGADRAPRRRRGRGATRAGRVSSPARSDRPAARPRCRRTSTIPGYRNVTFDELAATYAEATRALLEGGVDLLLVETIFDTLNAKAALFAIRSVLDELELDVPVMISGTITDASGRTLSGQTVEAFWNSVRHAKPLVIGLNCALGAQQLRPYVEELSRIADTYVCAYPNAGLPNAFGEYDETACETAELLRDFATQRLRQHRRRLLRHDAGAHRAHRARRCRVCRRAASRCSRRRCRLSGLEPVNIGPDSLFVNVGERTNVTGSAKFRRLIEADDYNGALDVARQQVANGAQVIDINMDEGMLDSEGAMVRFLNLLAAEPDIARVPVMIDSSKWSVIEAGLKCLQGKGVVNSISLKEGEGPFLAQARRVRDYGAAVVVMAFDEQGQADTVERKVSICERCYRLLTRAGRLPGRGHHLRPEHLRGRDRHRAARPLRARFHRGDARVSAQRCPGVQISGGVSNVSFSFRGNDPVREAMHSVFLYHAIRAGMTMGIVNAGQLAIYEQIDAGAARARRGRDSRAAHGCDRAPARDRRALQGRGGHAPGRGSRVARTGPSSSASSTRS